MWEGSNHLKKIFQDKNLDLGPFLKKLSSLFIKNEEFQHLTFSVTFFLGSIDEFFLHTPEIEMKTRLVSFSFKQYYITYLNQNIRIQWQTHSKGK